MVRGGKGWRKCLTPPTYHLSYLTEAFYPTHSPPPLAIDLNQILFYLDNISEGLLHLNFTWITEHERKENHVSHLVLYPFFFWKNQNLDVLILRYSSGIYWKNKYSFLGGIIEKS